MIVKAIIYEWKIASIMTKYSVNTAKKVSIAYHRLSGYLTLSHTISSILQTEQLCPNLESYLMAQQTLCFSLWSLKDTVLILLEPLQNDCQHQHLT